MSTIRLIAVGDFGARVVEVFSEVIADLEPIRWRDVEPMPPSLFSASDTIVAVERPEDALVTTACEAGKETGRHVVPLVLDQTNLVIGPMMPVDHGACWLCGVRRYRQDDLDQDVSAKSAGRPHPDLRPASVPRTHLHLAAAAAQYLLMSGHRARRWRSFVWTIPHANGVIQGSRLIGLHACRFCGLQRSVCDLTTEGLDPLKAMLAKREP